MIIATKLLGVGFGVLTLVMTYLVSGKYISSRSLQLFPALLLGLSYPFYFWSHMGLETPLMMFVCVSFLYVLLDEKLVRYWPVAAFLVFCTRPEGVLLCLLLIPLAIRERGQKGFWIQMAIFLALVAGLELGRLLYFHDVVAHSFYCKILIGVGYPLASLNSFFRDGYLFILLAVAFYFIVAGKRLNNEAGYLLIIALVVTLIWAIKGLEFHSPYVRAFTSLLPFLFIFIGIGADAGLKALNKYQGAYKTLWLCFPFVYLLSVSAYHLEPKDSNPIAGSFKVLSSQQSLADYYRYLFSGELNKDTVSRKLDINGGWTLYDNYHKVTGEFIRYNYPEGITIVYDQMGQTPWYAGLNYRFIDSQGLLDRKLGQFDFHVKKQYSLILRTFHFITRPVIDLFDTNEQTRVEKRK